MSRERLAQLALVATIVAVCPNARADAGGGDAALGVVLIGIPTALIGLGFGTADVFHAIRGTQQSRSYGIAEALMGLPVAAGGSLLLIAGVGEIPTDASGGCDGCTPGILIATAVPILALSLNMFIHGVYTAVREQPREDVTVGMLVRQGGGVATLGWRF